MKRFGVTSEIARYSETTPEQGCYDFQRIPGYSKPVASGAQSQKKLELGYLCPPEGLIAATHAASAYADAGPGANASWALLRMRKIGRLIANQASYGCIFP